MDLSILIPARSEIFLKQTIDDILKNIEGDTEVIAVLDGEWADPPVPDHKRVTLVHYPESIGQRAATNKAARMSRAKYLMKVDAHCAFDKGFDVKMMEAMQDDWTMVPNMKNLHAFDWVCKCGWRKYQGPEPTECPKCHNKTGFKKDIVWIGKKSPNSTSYRFNNRMQFKYFGQYKAKQEGDLVETMSLQGSCFMVTRKKYWELGLCDESWGSWGQQGTEVACKTHLSGGKVICNKKTWYAHMFRTQQGFRWPYPAPGRSQRNARKISRDIFFNNKWEKQIHPLSWLIEKFKPVPDWHDDEGKETLEMVNKEGKKFMEKRSVTKKPSRGIVYYTDGELDKNILIPCQKQIKKCFKGKIVNVSLKKVDFGENIVLPLEKGILAMFKQILAGLERIDTDIVFFAEHDVLYAKEHFDFTPPRKDIVYYNKNVWKVRPSDGFAIRTDVCKQTSGLCAYKDILLEHYRKRVKLVEKYGYNWKRPMGFEPGTHDRKERVDDLKSEVWDSKCPNIDIRHNKTFTVNRWKKEEFVAKVHAKGMKF